MRFRWSPAAKLHENRPTSSKIEVEATQRQYGDFISLLSSFREEVRLKTD
jgi:hypothetical protein